jgi:hypothetical protein
MGGMGPLIFFSICPFLAQYLYAQCCFDFDWPARSRTNYQSTCLLFDRVAKLFGNIWNIASIFCCVLQIQIVDIN